jgi:chromate transporter
VTDADHVPRGEALRAWAVISLQTFGGPAGQIAVMHRELVERRGWISDARFVRALSFCTMLPGPEAQQLAVYLGWAMNGTLGGIVAGTLFVLPGFVVMMVLSAVYARWGATDAVTALFAGLAPAVVAVVVQAVVRLARRSLDRRWTWMTATGAFAALALFGVPFPVVVAAAAAGGVAAVRRTGAGAAPTDTAAAPRARATIGRALRILIVGVALWTSPVIICALIFGGSSVFVQQGLFFSGTAVVTFGGAYAVLAFVAQRAVSGFGWLAPGEMVHGLALAESTPGPLIMVLQFVAFLGAYRDPGSLGPWTAALLGATLTVWVTFVPSFVFVLLGAPRIEALRPDGTAAAALRGVSAAVVGVIANLALYSALHTLFDRTRRFTDGPLHLELPVPSSVRPVPCLVAALAAGLLLGRGWGMLRVLAVCAAVGAALELAI